MQATFRTGAAVVAGGAVGALARWGVVEVGDTLGWSVRAVLVAINVAGAFALGWFIARERRTSGDALLVPFVAAGILGSFTTFSAFTVEAVEGVRGGDTLVSVAFVIGSMALGLVAVAAGRLLGVRS